MMARLRFQRLKALLRHPFLWQMVWAINEKSLFKQILLLYFIARNKSLLSIKNIKKWMQGKFCWQEGPKETQVIGDSCKPLMEACTNWKTGFTKKRLCLALGSHQSSSNTKMLKANTRNRCHLHILQNNLATSVCYMIESCNIPRKVVHRPKRAREIRERIQQLALLLQTIKDRKLAHDKIWLILKRKIGRRPSRMPQRKCIYAERS